MKNVSLIVLACVLATVAIAGPLRAVETVYVEHNTEEQFKKGDPCQTIISSTGEISLAYQTEKLLSANDDVWVVNAIVKSLDESLYVATSGKGYIYHLRDGQKPRIIYGKDEKDQKHVFSLALDRDGRLLAGTGGQAGLLLRFDKTHKAEVLYSADELKYIWSILVGPAGRMYLGTGPEGKVLTLNAKGRNVDTLYKSKEKNILALTLDADGILYAGGDENGLVYRIDPGSKKTTIVYDTGHSEISSLAFDEEGNLYVATSDASAARPGATLILSDGDISRAEKTTKEGDTKNDEKDSDVDQKEDKEKEKKKEEGEGKKQGGKKEKDTQEGRTEKLIPAATSKSGKDSDETAVPAKAKAPPTKPARNNEVYQISPDGYVTAIFQQKVVILSMVYMGDGRLLLGTGNEGKLIMLETASQEAVVLHTIRPSAQVSAVMADREGMIYVGGANPGSVLTVKPDYVSEGTYISEAIDAGQISKWGALQIEAEIPSGTDLKVSTRGGNTNDPKKGGWRPWSQKQGAKEKNAIQSQSARFLQYRLHLGSSDGKNTAIVKTVNLAHMIPNLPPRVDNVSVEPESTDKKSKPPKPSKIMQITWKSQEPNNDRLIHKVFIRQVGTQRWIRIGKELTETKFLWDSLTVADGRYEFRVTACDKPSNPSGQWRTGSRVSRAIIVDNTPPEIPMLSYKVKDNILRVKTQVNDGLSVIGAVDYILDSGESWQMALPKDGIFDSSEELVQFELKMDEPGEHLLAIRFTDGLGNQTYRNLTIPDATAKSPKNNAKTAPTLQY